MAAQPTHSPRTVLTTAGVGTAALLLAAAAAVPAFADGHGHGHGDGSGSPSSSSQSNNGNHHGQNKEHGNSGGQSGDDQSGGAQSGDQQSNDDQSSAPDSTSSSGSTHGKSGTHGNNGKSGSHSNNAKSGAQSGSTGHNPPGNNGTVKIHDQPGDQSPHNVPHVSCTFYVDFFGFDLNQSVTVSFAGQAPTGKGTALGGTQTLTPVSTDDAGGAGNDFDDEITVTADQLGVSALGPPAHQGYHIKMTVVTNQPGDHKYKVFWLQPCTTETATTPTTPTTTTTGTAVAPAAAGQVPSASQGGNAGESSGAATTSGEATTSNSAAAPTEVLGRTVTRSAPGSAAAPAASSLPFTGAEITGMAAAALIALAGGTALTVAGRRRRQGRSVS